MPLKSSGSTNIREIDRWNGGVGWLAHPDETMARASHALATDDGVWVVDPLDGPAVDDLCAELGEVAGVLVLLDRHKRDAAAIARRHDVPVSIPAWMTGVASNVDTAVERLDHRLPGTDYEIRRLVDSPFWTESLLYRPRDGTLYVSEALGTADYFRSGDERVGVHPMLRLTPPRSLAALSVERLLVGHGAGIFDGAELAVRDAVENARKRAPRAYFESVRGLLR